MKIITGSSFRKWFNERDRRRLQLHSYNWSGMQQGETDARKINHYTGSRTATLSSGPPPSPDPECRSGNLECSRWAGLQCNGDAFQVSETESAIVNAFNASCTRKHRCLTHVVERVGHNKRWMWSLEGSGDREGLILQPLQRPHRVGEGQRGVAVVGRQREPTVDVLLVGGWDLRGFARGDELVREREQRAVEGLVVPFVRDVGPVYMQRTFR